MCSLTTFFFLSLGGGGVVTLFHLFVWGGGGNFLVGWFLIIMSGLYFADTCTFRLHIDLYLLRLTVALDLAL